MSNYLPINSPRRAYKEVRQDGAFAPLVARYVGRLVANGYLASTRAQYVGAVSHFLYWLKRHDYAVAEIDTRLVKQYLDRHLPGCDCAPSCGRSRVNPRSALAQLLDLLHADGLTCSRLPPTEKALQVELADFERHLCEVCGLTQNTRANYLWTVCRFLRRHVRSRRGDIFKLTPQSVRDFVHECSIRRKPIAMRSIAVALRSYFRFKALDGTIVEPLVQAIPRIVRWRLSGLPRTLTPKEIQQLQGAFDRKRPKGLRDYAMLRCLTDLGLRSGEVARLQVDDIDWLAGTVRILGKGRRVQVLPWPRTVGTAVAEYLRRGRPPVHSRAVFVRARAPLQKPITSNTVGAAIREAAGRCRLPARLCGTHVLRHSVATLLVQRGTPFKLVADILGHRSLDTTAIYAKVDLPALKRVALPWPGGQQP